MTKKWAGKVRGNGESQWARFPLIFLFEGTGSRAAYGGRALGRLRNWGSDKWRRSFLLRLAIEGPSASR
jgi:hypothetical protein